MTLSSSESLLIVESQADNWHAPNKHPTWYVPKNAYDGDVTTFYAPQDHDAEENFLKLYLSRKSYIVTVKLTNRDPTCCQDRITGTVVKLYSTEGGGETKVDNCGGKITGKI